MDDSGITSEGVRTAKFREKLKGYHPADVDGFLEQVAASLDAVHDALREATARADRAEGALSASTDATESVTKTLVLAQRTAEMAISEAKEEAARIRAEAADLGTQTERARADAIAEAEASVAELRADSEREHAAAAERAATMITEAEATADTIVAAANERARAAEEDAAIRIAAAEEQSRATAEEHRAETVRAAEAAVRSLADQQRHLRSDVEALAHYLAGERARVLDVLTTAVDHFGHTLTPVVPDGAEEIERVLAEVRKATETIDPATEDSWSFDPTVLKQPENQWWSAGTEEAGSSAWPAEPRGTQPDAELLDSQTSTHVGSEPAHSSSDADPTASANAQEMSGPEASGPEASGPEASGPEASGPRVHAAKSPWSATPWSAPPERVAPGDDGVAVVGLPEGASVTEGKQPQGAPTGDASELGHPYPATSDTDDDPPARLLFTLEDDARRPDVDPVSADGRSRKLLGRRRI